MTKELSDWLRREGANCQKHIDCADALERLTTERDAYKGMYEAAHAMRGDAEVEALKAEAENAALREGLDGWHARFLDCEVEFARLVDVCHAAKLRLAAERDALKEQMTADREARPVCLWNNVDGCWETTCGNAFEINDGTPSENNMTYCCYCGGKVEEDIK